MSSNDKPKALAVDAARRAVGWSLVASLAALTLAIIAASFSKARGIADTVMFRDPAAEYDIPIYAGLFSNLGIASLCATAAVTSMTALVDPRVRLVGIIVATLSLGLAADDLLLIHEELGPRFLGVPEKGFYLAYAILGFMIFGLVLRTAQAQALGLVWVGSLLAASIFLDQMEFAAWFDNNLTEDTLKFMGLIGWFAFWVQFCLSFLANERS